MVPCARQKKIDFLTAKFYLNYFVIVKYKELEYLLTVEHTQVLRSLLFIFTEKGTLKFLSSFVSQNIVFIFKKIISITTSEFILAS